MAKKVKETPFPNGNRPSKYAWDQWLNGECWLLIQGEDFDIDVQPFRSCAIMAAKKRKLKVRTKRSTEGVYLQAYDPSDKGSK